MTKALANNPKSKGGNPAWQKGGPSPNPKGRPAEGESWAAVIKKVSNMTGQEATAYLSEFKKFSAALKGVTLKEAVVMRCFAALMFEPQASMFNAVVDRAEGKVAETFRGAVSVLNLNSDLEDKTEAQINHDLNALAIIAARLAGGSSESSEPVKDENSASKKGRKAHA